MLTVEIREVQSVFLPFVVQLVLYVVGSGFEVVADRRTEGVVLVEYGMHGVYFHVFPVGFLVEVSVF